jgi:hypothetical protein
MHDAGQSLDTPQHLKSIRFARPSFSNYSTGTGFDSAVKAAQTQSTVAYRLLFSRHIGAAGGLRIRRRIDRSRFAAG